MEKKNGKENVGKSGAGAGYRPDIQLIYNPGLLVLRKISHNEVILPQWFCRSLFYLQMTCCAWTV